MSKDEQASLVELCMLFFFSSRRRHTRFDCDWSSDVCSSDLRIGAAGGGIATPPGAPTSGAWDVTFGAGAKIAILDTGVNPVHPDVKDNLVFNLALTSYSAAFGTPNCEVPDPSNAPFDLPADQNGHGTWTSSLAAGEIGGGLLIGVAPQAKILNIKVLRNLAATPAQLNANKIGRASCRERV